MSTTMTGPEWVGLLHQAFPALPGAKMGTCAWCGKPRKRHHALCVSCWKSVPNYQRQHYLNMSLIARAHWILDNAPNKEPKP